MDNSQTNRQLLERVQTQLEILIADFKEFRSLSRDENTKLNDDNREFDTRLTKLQESHENLQKQVTEISKTSKETHDTVIGAKGTWKTVVAILSILAGLFTALFVKLINVTGISKFLGISD